MDRKNLSIHADPVNPSCIADVASAIFVFIPHSQSIPSITYGQTRIF